MGFPLNTCGQYLFPSIDIFLVFFISHKKVAGSKSENVLSTEVRSGITKEEIFKTVMDLDDYTAKMWDTLHKDFYYCFFHNDYDSIFNIITCFFNHGLFDYLKDDSSILESTFWSKCNSTDLKKRYEELMCDFWGLFDLIDLKKHVLFNLDFTFHWEREYQFKNQPLNLITACIFFISKALMPLTIAARKKEYDRLNTQLYNDESSLDRKKIVEELLLFRQRHQSLLDFVPSVVRIQEFFENLEDSLLVLRSALNTRCNYVCHQPVWNISKASPCVPNVHKCAGDEKGTVRKDAINRMESSEIQAEETGLSKEWRRLDKAAKRIQHKLVGIPSYDEIIARFNHFIFLGGGKDVKVSDGKDKITFSLPQRNAICLGIFINKIEYDDTLETLKKQWEESKSHAEISTWIQSVDKRIEYLPFVVSEGVPYQFWLLNYAFLN